MEHLELLTRVEHLLEATEGVAFIVPEDTGYFSIDDDLIGKVRTLVDEAIDLLGELTDFYDQGGGADKEDGGGTGEHDLIDIGALISSELASQELSGLAFAGRGQLVETREALLGALESRQIWAVASHGDTAIRRLGKALVAVETAMREFEELPPLERHWVDLGISLQIRRLYGEFRHEVMRGKNEPERDDLALRLEGVAERIAVLRNLEIYPFLRIDDRLAIRKLQKRIVAWLAGDRPAEEGLRLWQDLVSAAQLLHKVNEREELRQHDRQIILRTFNLFFAVTSPPDFVAPTHRSDLDRLRGLDEELDQVLSKPEVTPVDLEPPLSRLRRRLDSKPRQVQLGVTFPE